MFFVTPPMKVSSASTSESGPPSFVVEPKRPIVQRCSQTLQHKPCRLLSNAKSAVDFHAANAVLAANKHPKCRHPLVQTDRRILKDRIHLERELLIATTAEPQTPNFALLPFWS